MEVFLRVLKSIACMLQTWLEQRSTIGMQKIQVASSVLVRQQRRGGGAAQGGGERSNGLVGDVCVY